MENLEIVNVILGIMAILLHGIALFLLTCTKCTHKVLQKEYFIALCCIEVLLCLKNSFVLMMMNIQGRSMLTDSFTIISSTGFATYQYLVLAFIVIDKFTCIYMPLRYNSLFIKRYRNGILIVIAIPALTIASVFLALYLCSKKTYAKLLHLVAMYVWVPFDIIVLIISIFVYGYFAFVRSKLKQLDACRQLLASTAIIVSFILFYIIPDLFIAISGDIHDELFTLFILNCICDALFVTFFTKELRKSLQNVMCRSNEVLPR